MDATDRFAEAARAEGLDPAIARFPQGTRTAKDAAAAVGCEVGQIVKSLVFMADDEPLLVLTSGSNRVAEASLAGRLGVTTVAPADADQVRDVTGFAIGGTPPCGHSTRLRTVLDQDLLGYDQVWAAAGTPDSCFPVDPQMLVDVTQAEVIPVT